MKRGKAVTTTLIKNADWVVDLGPDGGDRGGAVIFEGTPLRLLDERDSFTAEHLRRALVGTGAPDAEVRARLTMSYILGVLIRSWARPNDLAGVRAEIERLAYAVLDGPAGNSKER